MPALPMFPLGTVLLPQMVLPLHVFEPRYRSLMHDVLPGTREFGVVLITRGHEVGGGEQRSDLGTVAKVVQAEELDDGRWLTITVGTRRIEVVRWLEDRPYPYAEVRDRPEEHHDAAILSLIQPMETRLRRILQLQAQLGEQAAPADFELSEDSEVACWQLAVMAPLTSYDAQRLLAVDRCDERLDLLVRLLTGVEETYRFQLDRG